MGNTGDTALSPLAFLTGRWVSEEKTEVQEENWSPAIGNSITGSFRIVQGGRPVFCEFWVVEVDENRPVLKLKHFNANLAGWRRRMPAQKCRYSQVPKAMRYLQRRMAASRCIITVAAIRLLVPFITYETARAAMSVSH